MIVVISPEQNLPHELDTFHQLCEAGLTHFHVRKPQFSTEEYRHYLQQINEVHHSKLVVHHHHHLIKEFGLKGVHYTEANRKRLGESLPQSIGTISTSFHSVTDLEQNTISFSYQFLSPVFTSISKKDYEGQNFTINTPKTVVALGGITTNNIHLLPDMGFKGAAVLGSIWQSKNPVEVFKQMVQQFNA